MYGDKVILANGQDGTLWISTLTEDGSGSDPVMLSPSQTQELIDVLLVKYRFGSQTAPVPAPALTEAGLSIRQRDEVRDLIAVEVLSMALETLKRDLKASVSAL